MAAQGRRSWPLDVAMQLLGAGRVHMRLTAVGQATESCSPCRPAHWSLAGLHSIGRRLQRRWHVLSSLLPLPSHPNLLPVPSQASLPVVGLLHKAWLLLLRRGHRGRQMRVSVLLLAG